MPRPKPTIPRVPVLIRLEPAALAFIDEKRGDLSRAAYIEGMMASEIGSEDSLGNHGPKARDRKERVMSVTIRGPANMISDTGYAGPPAGTTQEHVQAFAEALRPPLARAPRKRPDDATLKAMKPWERKQFGWE